MNITSAAQASIHAVLPESMVAAASCAAAGSAVRATTPPASATTTPALRTSLMPAPLPFGSEVPGTVRGADFGRIADCYGRVKRAGDHRSHLQFRVRW